MWQYVSYSELYHHGIKGQKWGIRRFQNKDGSLTPAGRKRYDEPSSKRKQKEYKIPNNKSLHRLKLEEKYKSKGLSEKEAEQAAAKRVRAEKFIAGAAVVTVAACVAYNKHKNFSIDKILSSDTEFHRILTSSDPDAPVRDGARYVSYKNKDMQKYRGIYGNDLRSKLKDEKGLAELRGLKDIPDKKIYDMTIKSKNSIKVASEKRARETFTKLYRNDREFRDTLNRLVDDNRMGLLGKKGFGNGDTINAFTDQHMLGDISDKTLKGKGYDLFNILLVSDSQEGRNVQKKFYDSLKEQGMNAVMDLNDKKYSGYKSKAPLILFDGAFEYSKKVLEDSKITEDYYDTMSELIMRPVIAKGMAVVAAASSVKVATSRAVQKQVMEYKKQHPNTTMSEAEIINMLKRKRG